MSSAPPSEGRFDVSSTLVWIPAAPNLLESRTWDGEMVVYNDATGNTHHLSPLGSHVLQALLRREPGVGLDALVTDIESGIEAAEALNLRPQIERALNELAELRLAFRHFI
jgi:PqqD family protein of HPr-rel-A system